MKRFEIYKNNGSKAYSICAFEDGISHYPYAILCTDSLRRGIDFIHLRSEDLVREQATIVNDFGLKEEYDKLCIDDHLLVGSIPVLFYKKPYLLISPSISNTELNLLNPSKLNI